MKKNLLFCLLLFIQTTYAAKRFVKPVSAGSGNATSWSNASSDLAGVLNASSAGDTVWVANGTYKPTNTSNRAISFVINSGVVVLGGFVGTETSPIQRPVFDVNNIQTNLSGNIGTAALSDNSYNVVRMIGSTASTVLERFQIFNGSSNQTDPVSTGGGIYIENGSPQIYKCVFFGHNASSGGGIGFYASAVGTFNPVISESVFYNNYAPYGGALSIFRTSSSAVNFDIKKCVFTANDGSYGGAINNHSGNITISNSIINSNHSDYGGGIYTEGVGSTTATGKAIMNIVNSTFTNNSFNAGGSGSSIHNFVHIPVKVGHLFRFKVGQFVCLFWS
jgi:hypothetical protein